MMAELTNVIRVFISSKQREFVEERQGMTEIVRRLPLLAADAAEEWAPGRDSIEATFLARVRAAPIYVGLFGRVYSPATAREYETAVENPHREMLTYVKRCDQVEAPLEELIQRFDNPREGHTVKRFDTWADLKPAFEQHLWSAVHRMIESYLALAAPAPVARGSGVTARRWQHERDHLLALGLPGADDAAQARTWADTLRRMYPAAPS